MILALLLITATPPSSSSDSEPPIIEDIAAAASNPDAAPVVTVMMSDPDTGVGLAFVLYRGVGATAWEKAELKGGTSGLFIAHLPDGLQKSGFEYYVEATDVAGNGPTRIGSPDAPIRVDRATEATKVRIERQQAQQQQQQVDVGPKIHPGWLMLSLGVGILAGAGAGAYGLDLAGTNTKIATTNEKLADPDLSDRTRTALLINRDSLRTAAVQDTVITSILGIVGAAGIATGTTLVIISSLE